jgi:hypothetical protein
MCGRFFESPSSLGLGPAKRGIPGAVSKEEALLMRENKAQRHTSEKRSPCQINHLFGGAPCPKAAKEKVDALLLCQRHALEAKLEGQIECWGGMLFHIELWSREAARREREDVVELLEVQRLEATSARQRAYEDLDVLRKRETPWQPRRGPPPTRGSLLLLPLGGARPPFRGLRRHLRR